jgi:UDP-N-acetylglucosamine transferase subunit ALG13
MILVTTGTNGAAFDRLLQELDDLAADEQVIVQHGPSALRPRGATCVDYLPFDELKRLMVEARVVVTHGGAGSVLATLSSGHRPLVISRRVEHREAVDDHQEAFVQRLGVEGLVTVVDEPSQLSQLVRTATRCGAGAAAGGRTLREELREYLQESVGTRT